jgi:hypothetical protein
MKYLSMRDFLWITPLSLGLGVALSILQSGNWLIGWLAFSLLLLLSLSILVMSTRWAGGTKTLAWMIALAFTLRFAGGVATYLALPVDGFEDEDDKAGFIFTDAHRRDSQAWELAGSDLPIYDAFNKTYAYDQYGGLLAFSALVYRYLSPDAHRPLMLVLLSAFIAALGLPFLWRAASQQWGAKVAGVSGWIYALYPESVLLGGSAMREPYLMAFSALSLWGFVIWQMTHSRRSLSWLGIGIAGMLLVSPGVALATIILLLGWMFFASEHGRAPWWLVVGVIVVFVVGLFVLSSALDRQGNLGGGTPIGIINNFLREVVKWDMYQLEGDSGRVQKIFNESPEWLHLPFVVTYGVLQPVVIPAFIEPTTLTWRIIAILRGVGWYALLPVLVFSLVAAAGSGAGAKRNLWMWISFFAWTWILFAALRGGGDQWDNPRYRAIMFLWQALLAGQTWVWWRESKNPWLKRIILMEVVLLAFFGEWYADRYFQIGGKMSFGPMVAAISGIWFLIVLIGLIRDRRSHA